MYDTFSTDYDRFVNWPSRLAYELPFIERYLGNGSATRVLDAACGTGMHAVALAQRGYRVAGADLSQPMIVRARANARAAGVQVRFEATGFGRLEPVFKSDPAYPFDAVLCMGNSLPHVLMPDELMGALRDFAACLRPGGLLLLQNRNFAAVLNHRERWMEPQSHQQAEDGQEWLFLRFYDFGLDGLIDFNILTLHRAAGGSWQQQVTSTLLRPWLQAELARALTAAGFEDLRSYGDMTGAAYDPSTSGNLIITARKASD